MYTFTSLFTILRGSFRGVWYLLDFPFSWHLWPCDLGLANDYHSSPDHSDWTREWARDPICSNPGPFLRLIPWCREREVLSAQVAELRLPRLYDSCTEAQSYFLYFLTVVVPEHWLQKPCCSFILSPREPTKEEEEENSGGDGLLTSDFREFFFHHTIKLKNKKTRMQDALRVHPSYFQKEILSPHSFHQLPGVFSRIAEGCCCLKPGGWHRWPFKDASSFKFLSIMLCTSKRCLGWRTSDKFSMFQGWDSASFCWVGIDEKCLWTRRGDAAPGQPANSRYSHRSNAVTLAVFRSVMGNSVVSIPKAKTLLTVSRAARDPHSKAR